jgi:hypothetical protein
MRTRLNPVHFVPEPVVLKPILAQSKPPSGLAAMSGGTVDARFVRNVRLYSRV